MNQIRFTDMGFAVKKKNILKAVFSKGLLYTVISGGEIARLAVIDIATMDVLKLLDLDGAVGAWSLAMGGNGCIYAGTYYNGHLYKYDYGKDLLEDLGQPVPEQSFIWDMDAGKNKRVYGGTYNGCRVFELNEENGETICFDGPIVENEEYVRSIAFDNDGGDIYIGISSHPYIIKYDLKERKKTDITPEQYKGKSCVLDLNEAAGKLFAIIGNDLAVIDKATGTVENAMTDIVSLSRGVSKLSPCGNYVYFTANHTLYMYDIIKNIFQSLQIDTQEEIMGFGFETDNKFGFEGDNLVGLTKDGRLFKYGLLTGEHSISEIPGLPAQPVDIQTIRKGPDGNIYCSGYLLGGMGVYYPESRKILQYEGIKQVEGMCVIGRRMFFGKYPGSEIFEFDASAKWDAGGALPNPKKLFDLRKDYAQDRTFAMAGMEDKRLLFIGSVPEYGKLGGAFTQYNIDTGSLTVYNNIIDNQSVVSLACRGNEVFGGTSVWGGLGQRPTENEAKFFIWDVEKLQKTFEIVPVKGKKAITSLIRAADDNIWGLAEGTLFIFNPISRKIIYTSRLFPVDYSSCGHMWRDAFMECGPDGNVYGIIGFSTKGGRVFRINTRTRELSILAEKEVSGMTMDSEGNFYLICGKRLLKAEI